MTSQTRGAAFVVLGTAGFAFKGILARLIYAEGLTPAELLGWRMILAVPLFWLGLRVLTGHATLPRTRRDFVAIAIGAGFAVAALADFEAVRRLGAGPSRVVLFTYPLFVLALQSVVDRVRPATRDLLAFAVAWVGLLLVAAPAGVVPDPVGVLAGLTASVTYALYLVGAQPMIRELGSTRFTTLTNTGAMLSTLAALPLLVPSDASLPSTAAVGWLILLVVVSTVLPFFALFEGIAHIGAPRAGLLALVGPPMTLAAAWVLLGEQLTVGQLAGSALVVLAVASLKRVDTPQEDA